MDKKQIGAMLAEANIRADQITKMNGVRGVPAKAPIIGMIIQNLYESLLAIDIGVDVEGIHISPKEIGNGLKRMLDYLSETSQWAKLQEGLSTVDINRIVMLAGQIHAAADALETIISIETSRTMPSSERNIKLPELPSFKELEKFILRTFTPKEYEYSFWITPNELCDIVERYAELIAVEVFEYSCVRSQDMFRISLFPKDSEAASPLEFHGLFLTSHNPIDDYRSQPALLKVFPELAGIKDRYHLNFEGNQRNKSSILNKNNEISPNSLRERIQIRREHLGIDKLNKSTKMSPSTVYEQPKEYKINIDKKSKKWWKFWIK